MTITHQSYYPDKFGNGNAIASYQFSGEHRPVSPETVGEKLVKILCSGQLQ